MLVHQVGQGPQNILDYAKEKGIPSLDAERALVERCEQGDQDAVWELALRHSLSAIKVGIAAGYDADDLFMAGVAGLVRAAQKVTVKKWDKTLVHLQQHSRRGVLSPFYCYAKWWIRTKKTREESYQGTSVTRTKDVLSTRSRGRNIEALEAASNCIDVYGAEGKAIPFEMPGLSLDDQLEIAEIRAAARDILTARELVAFEMSHGLGQPPRKLRDIAAAIGVTSRERARQVAAGATAAVAERIRMRDKQGERRLRNRYGR